MSKKLNSSSIQNELSGQSVFFQHQEKQKSQLDTDDSVRGVRDGRDVRGVRTPIKRERKRHPFDIYHDQLQQLQQMKTARMMQTGAMRSMSEMVREALDDYITKHQ
jgi:hypothetical protein